MATVGQPEKRTKKEMLRSQIRGNVYGYCINRPCADMATDSVLQGLERSTTHVLLTRYKLNIGLFLMWLVGLLTGLLWVVIV